ncbi:MAG TPA: hypothetical protein VI248_14135, partial [Kineosporiaceae bacterium]
MTTLPEFVRPTGALPPVAATTALPDGRRLQYALYPRALLRTSGFDARPLNRMLDPGPDGTPDTVLTALREAFADPRLEEAVAQSNPSFHEIAFAPGRALTTDTGYQELTKRGRRQVRTAHRYLRRLLGRTETNAFFGPTLVVAWDPDTTEPMVVGDPAPEQRALGLSHWVVQELADRQRRQLPPSGRGWSRDPLWLRQGASLRRALDGRLVTLTEPAIAVWQALRTPASAAELLAVTGLAARDVATALGLLSPALRPHPRPPSTLIDGLGWLLEHRTSTARQGPDAPDGADADDRATDRLVERLADLT